jgi:hypothetical protein
MTTRSRPTYQIMLGRLSLLDGLERKFLKKVARARERLHFITPD